MRLFRQFRANDFLVTKEVNGSVRLHMQRSDNRGVRLHTRIKNGALASNVARLWAALNWHHRPSLCLDVGANYGEVSLTTRYENGQFVHLFEANPYVANALERSIKCHRDRNRIRLTPHFIGDKSDQVEFHIDLKWSGTSSAFFRRSDGAYKGSGKQQYESRYVKRSTLSELVSSQYDDRLLLKIDVEGAELEVLRGARELLDSVQSYFIILEFNKAVIRLSGGDTEKWIETAASLGRIYLIRQNLVTPLKGDVIRNAGKVDLLIGRLGGDARARTALRVVRAGPL